MEIINYENYNKDILEDLIIVRIQVMEESLKAINRFDPDRARTRFLNTFDPPNCYLIFHNDKLHGFFLYKTSEEFIKLEHLYIPLKFQGMGLGQIAIKHIKNEALKINKKIRLFALKKSRANNFYLCNGFVKVDEEEFDNIYEWHSNM